MKIDELYSDLWPELCAYCGQMTGGCRTAAEDIVQESFLRALQNAALFEEMDRPHCRAWLYKAARNIFIDKVRRAAAESARLSALDTEEAFEDPAFAEAEAAALLLLLPEGFDRWFDYLSEYKDEDGYIMSTLIEHGTRFWRDRELYSTQIEDLERWSDVVLWKSDTMILYELW